MGGSVVSTLHMSPLTRFLTDQAPVAAKLPTNRSPTVSQARSPPINLSEGGILTRNDVQQVESWAAVMMRNLPMREKVSSFLIYFPSQTVLWQCLAKGTLMSYVMIPSEQDTKKFPRRSALAHPTKEEHLWLAYMKLLKVDGPILDSWRRVLLYYFRVLLHDSVKSPLLRCSSSHRFKPRLVRSMSPSQRTRRHTVLRQTSSRRSVSATSFPSSKQVFAMPKSASTSPSPAPPPAKPLSFISMCPIRAPTEPIPTPCPPQKPRFRLTHRLVHPFTFAKPRNSPFFLSLSTSQPMTPSPPPASVRSSGSSVRCPRRMVQQC
eukprot:NODE_850_length_1282_cov_215.665856_g647_i0.p1 GENE.NODE_850_length_1282_cov_215.665856_g647_i0~~NODE_850_length_1282_cov_215.665856_g647_i0.p1  ORF type:complete len:337 (-),score=43.34 NODE_850_length_1282_cov_215.665856_g647_i0:270-1229(-)